MLLWQLGPAELTAQPVHLDASGVATSITALQCPALGEAWALTAAGELWKLLGLPSLLAPQHPAASAVCPASPVLERLPVSGGAPQSTLQPMKFLEALYWRCQSDMLKDELSASGLYQQPPLLSPGMPHILVELHGHTGAPSVRML